MTVQHIVLFKFPEPLSAADETEIRARVQGWVEAIPGIRKLRFGKDLTGERTRGHSHLLYMEFDSVEEMRAYQAHPVHKDFHAWVLERGNVPLAFDYELDSDTVLIPEDRSNGEEERQ